MNPYPGLGNLMKLSDAETRSVSAENVYGEKGRGGMARMEPDHIPEEIARIGQVWRPNRSSRELGTKWKVRPCIVLPKESTTLIMDVNGPGVIQHIWITVDDKFWRDLILRIYWDDETTPSVETPLGDFFCNGWRKRTNINALPICVNPSGGFNCYFPMPFRRRARVTIENRSPYEVGEFFYTINYALQSVAEDDAYFHAQFRRVNPVKYGDDVTILEAAGKGHYVGTFLAWQQNSAAWWGEGELKVFLDGDGEYPTICGTGTEDYFGGAWCFARENYSTPFLGYPYGHSEGSWEAPAGSRHLLYRFHILDPIRFHLDIKVTIQALGWRSDFRYLPLQDDISSVAYWYQAEPHAPFPVLPDRLYLEVV
jgi:hypothetical protein